MRSRRPDFRLALVGTGAAFLRGLAERAPGRSAVAVDRGQGYGFRLEYTASTRK